MKYLVDEFANIKNQIFQPSITVDIFYFEGIDVLYCFHGNFIPTCVLLKQHQSMVGGPNPSCCPICQKLCMTGEQLMDHMKYVHKDPNASGVPGECMSHGKLGVWVISWHSCASVAAKRRNANHPCPVCGKFYVNEGSLRKHLACHPEMPSQLASSLRMWPCSVCTAVFTHENGWWF